MPRRRRPEAYRHAVTWAFPRLGRWQSHTPYVASDEAVPLPGIQPGVRAEPAYRYLSAHQAAVLDAATRRLDLGPRDDPDEHRVIIYVDRLLSVLNVAPGGLHVVGSLRQRVAELRNQYTGGIALLDQLAGGDFTTAPPLRQQLILARSQLSAFVGMLFGHIIEAMGVLDAEVRFR
jgi:hypothetical protein